MEPDTALERLGAVLAGTWSVDGWSKTDPSRVATGWVAYEWEEGRSVLRGRWQIDTSGIKDDGVVLIADQEGACLGRHADDASRLVRFDFRAGSIAVTSRISRFRGIFDPGGLRCSGRWEIRIAGSRWRYWYEATYGKVLGQQ